MSCLTQKTVHGLWNVMIIMVLSLCDKKLIELVFKCHDESWFPSGKDIPAERAGNILPPRTAAGRTLGMEPHPLDTILIVKRWLHEDHPSQELAVAIPYQYVAKFLQQHGTVPVNLKAPNDPVEASGWLRCALALLDCYEEASVKRSVQYLRRLARGEMGKDTRWPELFWMRSCVGDEALAHAIEQPHMPNVVIPGLETRVVFRARDNQ